MRWFRWTVVFVLVFSAAVPAWSAEEVQTVTTPQMGDKRTMRCESMFDGMDTNHDGILTLDEMKTARHARGRGEQLFKARDTNGDGIITKEEFCAERPRRSGPGKGAPGTTPQPKSE